MAVAVEPKLMPLAQHLSCEVGKLTDTLRHQQEGWPNLAIAQHV